METKHTPGPWEIEPDNNWECLIHTPNDNHYFEIFNQDIEGFEEMLANARLIKAAPDMLKALIEANEILVKLYSYCRSVRKAIIDGEDVKFLDVDDLDDIMLAGKQVFAAINKATGHE